MCFIFIILLVIFSVYFVHRRIYITSYMGCYFGVCFRTVVATVAMKRQLTRAQGGDSRQGSEIPGRILIVSRARRDFPYRAPLLLLRTRPCCVLVWFRFPFLMFVSSSYPCDTGNVQPGLVGGEHGTFPLVVIFWCYCYYFLCLVY